MRIQEFIKEINQQYPEIDKYAPASNEMIEACEGEIGYKLPSSFKTFLKNFSNGIFLLDCEPIGGTSIESPCGKICKTNEIILNIPDNVIIQETNEHINSNYLISFTMYDAGDVSNNHWVFICEDGIPDNNYRVGFISQNSMKLVKILSNFEEWITIFWNKNKSEEDIKPVFYSFYPTFDERFEILNS